MLQFVKYFQSNEYAELRESAKKVQEDLQYMNLQQLEAVLLKIYHCLNDKHLVCTIVARTNSIFYSW